MAPRGRPRKKMVGSSRMDAALDAMKQFGFEEKLVQETVNELLDVYQGAWPFIEDGSYNLLIETILAKQEDKNKEENLQENTRRDGVALTSSADATFATGITEVGSSSLVVNHDPSLLHASADGLDSASRTNDHDQDTIPPSNQSTDVKDSTVPAERKEQNEPNPSDNVNTTTQTHMNNVGTSFVKTNMTTSLEAPEKVQQRRRKPCYGWISDDDSDDGKVELIHLPLPPLPEHIEKLLGQSSSVSVASQTKSRIRRGMRKSRWDEKPDV
ncbi:uncharacterized protein LOC130939138 [Arachis stenosperma]|uniref:uncharacterized protein n=1 Tax=Arachis hypogaea TaxID=3818 RepID=UPI000DEC5BF3|nr:uncharacterized protein LOC112702413 isoform X1 [Arachis hypogaea]XP_057723218.1 uncharacterized protein LOC130939138 [Arachis stenosperma]QHO27346.1 hypothetical protein DS421_7g207270 [Arachis hypogaea]